VWPQWKQFVDVWPSLYPTEPGFTYDPQRNALAAENSSSGRSR
jgi:poly(A) polymerase